AQAEVESAADVAQAIDALREFVPDVLISDVAMPEQDGFDLVTFLRRSGYGADRLPAVAFTAFASAEHKRPTLEVGFQAFLSKPIDPREVVETVARLAVRRD